MAVDSFPIAPPATPFVSVEVFDVQRRQSAGLNGSGRNVTIDRGIPGWKFSGKTRDLFEAEVGAWEAFRAKLRGAARYFTMYNPRRPYPLAYLPAGPPAMNRAAPYAGAFEGHGSLAAIGSSLVPGGVGRDLLTIGAPYALPAGFLMGYGDYIEARQGANLLGVSDFSGTWAKVNATLTPNNATAPDGTTTAATLSRVATGTFSAAATIADTTTNWAGRFVRASIWLKLGTLTGTVPINVRDGAGTVQFSTVASPTSNWQRFEISGQVAAGAAAGLKLTVNPTLAPGLAGQTLLAWKSLLTRVDTETVSLHRVLDTAQLVADSTGTLTAWVEPELPSSFTIDALINVYQARAKWALVDFQLPVDAKPKVRPGQVTLTAMSTLL